MVYFKFQSAEVLKTLFIDLKLLFFFPLFPFCIKCVQNKNKRKTHKNRIKML